MFLAFFCGLHGVLFYTVDPGESTNIWVPWSSSRLVERWQLRTTCEENLWQSRPWTAWIHDSSLSAKTWILRVLVSGHICRCQTCTRQRVCDSIELGMPVRKFFEWQMVSLGHRVEGTKSSRKHQKTTLTIQIKYVSTICTECPSKSPRGSKRCIKNLGQFPGGCR